MKRKLFTLLFTTALSSVIHITLNAQNPTVHPQLNDFLLGQGFTGIQLGKLPTGHLVTDVSLNGHNAVFIIDTGAGATVIDQKKGEQFALNPNESNDVAVGAGGGSIPVGEAVVELFQMNQYELNELTVRLISLEHINVALCQMGYELDGVIGADILIKGEAVIDYYNHVLYLRQ